MGIELLMLSLDGVIFDTETAHLNACNATFAQLDLRLRWTRQQYRAAAHAKGPSRAMLALGGKDFASNDIAHMIEIKSRLFHEAVADVLPARIPALQRLIDDAFTHGCKLAVVTDMAAQPASMLLEAALGAMLHDIFSVVVTAADFNESTGNGVHHLVLRTVDIEPHRCAAIDQTAPGLRSAQQAGIWTLPVTPVSDESHRYPNASFESLDALERHMASDLLRMAVTQSAKPARLSA